LQALLGLWKAEFAAPTSFFALVSHHNRCKNQPESPAEVLPAPNQLRNMFQKSVFSQKKAQEEAKKDSICPELQQAAAAGCCQQGGAVPVVYLKELPNQCFRC